MHAKLFSGRVNVIFFFVLLLKHSHIFCITNLDYFILLITIPLKVRLNFMLAITMFLLQNVEIKMLS